MKNCLFGFSLVFGKQCIPLSPVNHLQAGEVAMPGQLPEEEVQEGGGKSPSFTPAGTPLWRSAHLVSSIGPILVVACPGGIDRLIPKLQFPKHWPSPKCRLRLAKYMINTLSQQQKAKGAKTKNHHNINQTTKVDGIGSAHIFFKKHDIVQVVKCYCETSFAFNSFDFDFESAPK